MTTGRFCDKHQEWCPAGECRWCEPAKAEAAPQAAVTPGPETGLYPHLPHETYPEWRERNGLGPLLDGAGLVAAAEIANDALVELGRPEKLDIERADVYGKSPCASLLDIAHAARLKQAYRPHFESMSESSKLRRIFGTLGVPRGGGGATVTIRDCDSCPECLKERIKVLSVALGQAIGSASVLAFSNPSPTAREAAIAQLEAASDAHLKDQRDHLA